MSHSQPNKDHFNYISPFIVTRAHFLQSLSKTKKPARKKKKKPNSHPSAGIKTLLLLLRHAKSTKATGEEEPSIKKRAG